MKYQIRYNHRSPETASSLESAKRTVRREARVSRLSYYSGTDAIYCWKSAADQAADADGSRAFATIESAAQRALHG